MSVKTNGSWRLFLSETDAKNHRGGVRILKLNWQGRGWYYVTEYSQRCPRGCCYDSVLEFRSAEERVNEVKEGMKELAEELKDARAKIPKV